MKRNNPYQTYKMPFLGAWMGRGLLLMCFVFVSCSSPDPQTPENPGTTLEVEDEHHHQKLKKEKWNDDHYRITKEKHILIGDTLYFECPGVVNVKKVFRHIPAWKKIQKRNLDEEDSEYWSLMRKANKQFWNALHRVKKYTDHDFITREGAVKPKTENTPSPCDLTENVIKSLHKPGVMKSTRTPEKNDESAK